MEICYSHPDKPLITHISNVRNIGISIFKSEVLNFSYGSSDLLTTIENILLLHDFGKATKYFQSYLLSKIKGVDYNYEMELKNHAQISAIYASYKTFNELNSSALALICYVVILKHHGNLQNMADMVNISLKRQRILKEQYHSIDWNAFKKINIPKFKWDELNDYLNELWIYNQNVDKNEEYFFLTKYFYSILIYSDKNEAAFSGLLPQTKLNRNFEQWITNYKHIVFKNSVKSDLNRMREVIFEQVISNSQKPIKENILFLNVPTGLGKTLSGLQAAFSILRKNHLNKIIYAVPFTSIIDQIQTVISDILKANQINAEHYFLSHHHLVEPKIQISEDLYQGEKGLFLIENWDKPIILTTFWQIFNTLFWGENRLNRKLHQLNNSIIIFDEIQTLPIEYWKIIRESLEHLTHFFGCKIIYMTATLPLLFKKDEIKNQNLVDLKNKELLKRLNRYSINIIQNLNSIEFPTFIKHLISTINQNNSKSVLIVINTIRESILVFNWLKKNIDRQVEYLSTNIIPKDRIIRINRIHSEKRPSIVVSTQLIEAGVDLDFDIVYRDLAPLDSVIQTAGRCNRNMRGEGVVFLFSLKDREKDRNFSSYVYSDLSLTPTRDLLSSVKIISESELPDLLDKYYKNIINRSSSNIYQRIKGHLYENNFESLKNDFVLIKNMPEQLLFVEKDSEASDILNQYHELNEHFTGMERRDAFLKIKKSFYDYVISVKINKNTVGFLKSFEEAGNFLILPAEMVDQFYKDDIGLSLKIDNFI